MLFSQRHSRDIAIFFTKRVALEGFLVDHHRYSSLLLSWAPFVNPYGAGIYSPYNHIEEDLLQFRFPSANSMCLSASYVSDRMHS